MIKLDLNKGVVVSPMKEDLGLIVIDSAIKEPIHKTQDFKESLIINTSYYRDLNFLVHDKTTKKVENFKQRFNTVVIEIHSKALGDQIAWMPIIDLFQKKNNIKVVVRCYFVDLFKDNYPNLDIRRQYFVGEEITEKEEVLADAVYIVGYAVNGFTNQENITVSPEDCRTLSLQEVACVQLGMDKEEVRPDYSVGYKRIIKGKYICITTCAAGDFKFWHYPNGWQSLVDYYTNLGYKVVHVGDTPFKLKGVIRKTGKLQWNTLKNLIQHAEVFIGLSSGLSWLAWSVGQRVVTINGITLNAEFVHEKVQNTNVCHGCWNDTDFIYENDNPEYCPHNKDFECTKSITPEMVIKQVGL